MWTREEEEHLSSLTIKPHRHSKEELEALVRHFKSDGTLYSITEMGKPVLKSLSFTRKIRRLVQEGKMNWLSSEL